MRKLLNVTAILVAVVLALLSGSATRFYYPTFRKRVEILNNFLGRHQADMIRLNAISGTELTQLQALQTDLNTIVTNPNWPKYKELA